MTKTKVKPGFTAFMTKFPVAELPITLNEENLRKFNKNKPLSTEQIQTFCQQEGDTDDDEYTEYIACLRLPDTEFYGFILWRATLLEYTYTLATFDKSGTLLEKKVIAGTKIKGETFLSLVATIINNREIAINTTLAPQNTLPKELTATQRLSISKSGEISIPDSFYQIWNY